MPNLVYDNTFDESGLDGKQPQSWDNYVSPYFKNIRTLLNTTGLDAVNLGVTAGQVTASKALVVDASRNLADGTASNQINNLTLSGTFTCGTVSITGGSVSGITDLAVADGGTGASTASAARTNLGLVIGSDVQAYDPELQALSGLTPTDGNFIVGNGSTFITEDAATSRTSLGLGSIATQASNNVTITGGSVTGIVDVTVADGGTGASDAAGARTNLGLVIGTNVQAYDAGLADIAGLATSDGNVIVGSGSNWVAESGATARASLGLGSIATQASDSVSITGGSVAGITDITVADGGTGASNASGARTNLGVAIGSDVQAYDAGLADIAALATSDGNIIVGSGSNWVAESGATARTSLGLGSIATQAADNVSISGGSLIGMTSYSGGSFSGTTGTFSGKLAVTSTASTYEGMELVTPSGDGSGVFQFGVHQSGSTAGRGIEFRRGGSDGFDTLSLAITADGNVEMSGEKLKLGGTTYNGVINNIGSVRINVDSDNNGSSEYFAVGHNQESIDANNELFRVQEDGKVGISTSSPTHKLSVVGSINNGIHVTADTDTDFDPDSGYANDALILKNSTAGNNNPVSMYFSTGSNGEVRFSAIDDATSGDANLNLSLRRSGGSRANVQFWEAGTGFVGIGTTTPTATHTVQAASNTIHVQKIQNTAGNVVQETYVDGSGNPVFNIRNSSGIHKMQFSTYENSFINAGFKFGLGTNSPRCALNIDGNESTAVTFGIDNTSGGGTLDISCLGATYTAHGAAPGEVWFYSPDNINIGGATGNTNDIKFLGAGAEIARFTSDGDLLIGEASDQIARVYSKTSVVGDYAYIGVTTGADRGPISFANTSASLNDIMLVLTATRTATTAFDFARFSSGNGADIEFLFEGDGNAYADGSWNGSGADYQEYFESQSGSEAEVGRAIVLDGDRVRYYNADTDSTDDIMGVTRPQADNKNSAVVGNVAWNHWTDKYLTDDWGVYLREDVTVWTHINEKGEDFAVYERDELAKDPNWTPPEGATSSTESVRKLNPDYDESLKEGYQSRRDRDEWWLIGLLGQIQVKAGEPTNPRWIKMKNISDAVELYYVR